MNIIGVPALNQYASKQTVDSQSYLKYLDFFTSFQPKEILHLIHFEQKLVPLLINDCKAKITCHKYVDTL